MEDISFLRFNNLTVLRFNFITFHFAIQMGMQAGLPFKSRTFCLQRRAKNRSQLCDRLDKKRIQLK